MTGRVIWEDCTRASALAQSKPTPAAGRCSGNVAPPSINRFLDQSAPPEVREAVVCRAHFPRPQTVKDLSP
jgi:hypothetical protein